MDETEHFVEAISLVKTLVGEMSAADLEEFPLVRGELNEIRERLNFIFGNLPDNH